MPALRDFALRALMWATGTAKGRKIGGGYRPDIDGLRAVAVLAVIGYHYGPSYIPGGFVGVDVFFVISGYLITGILAKAFETQTFGYSLLDFYQRRIRRIFPAVSLVLAFCLAVGWLVLFPFEYESLGNHVAASAGFVQNFVLWLETGYFDTGAIEKPLLHFWSLAVEEQFYIFWPLALWVIVRQRWPLMAAIATIAALSFVWNVWLVWNGHASAAFYLPATRAWELMVGAWLAIGHRYKLPWLSYWPSAQSWLGAILLAAGVLLIRPEYGFPGFWALMPVVGTALLISAGPSTFLNRRLLSLRPAVWVGLISYPLYLWHWVLLSLTFTIFGLTGNPLGHAVKIGLIALSFLLAWLTYRLLEIPLRRRKGSTAVVLALAVAVIGLGGLGVYADKGVPNRPLTTFAELGASYAASIKWSPLKEDCYGLNNGPVLPEQWYCVLGDPNAETWIMAAGDSHSLSMIPALDHYGKSAGVRVVYAGISGCLALLETYRDYESSPGRGTACLKLAKRTAALVKNKKASAIVLIQRWSVYSGLATSRPEETVSIQIAKGASGQLGRPVTGLAAFKHGVRTTLAYYQPLGIPVVLIEDNPQQIQRTQPMTVLRFSQNASEMVQALNASSVTLAQHLRDQARTNKVLENIAADYPVVSILNIDSALCRQTICPWVKDGKFLYYNDDHLSIAGAMQIYPLLAEHLNQILGRKKRQ